MLRSREVIAYVIEAMIDAVLVVDGEGRITLNNTAASRVTGYTSEQLRRLPIKDVLDDESSGIRTVVRQRIEHGDVLRRQEAWLKAASGERIPVSVTASPVLDDSGHFHGIVIVARDIRELRQLLTDKEAEIERRRTAEAELHRVNSSMEEQLEQTRASLLLAERRATLGTLAGGVGHELRNIAQIHLAAVDELEQALEHGNLAEVARTVLPDLQRVTDHITTHGRWLLQLARPGPDRVEPLELQDVIRDVVAMLARSGKLKRVDIRLDLGAEPFAVTVNRTRIEQILVNLVINAVDAIGDGAGSIEIAVRPNPEGTRVACSIRDTGPGIPPGDLDRIFQPFFTTKSEDRGTGLGLPVARHIVESYGGKLTAASRVGEGTTFTFDLPRA